MRNACVEIEGEIFRFDGMQVDRIVVMLLIAEVPSLRFVSINNCLVTAGLLREMASAGTGKYTVRTGESSDDEWDDVFLPRQPEPTSRGTKPKRVALRGGGSRRRAKAADD